jgi:hypothetical protein
MIANLLEHPTYKIEDRRRILLRILAALLADPDCRYDFKSAWKYVEDEHANWDARESVIRLLRTFPVPTDNPPPAEIEPPDGEAIDEPAEA